MKMEMYYGINWDNIHAEEFIKIINDHMAWYRSERIKLSLRGQIPLEYRRSLGMSQLWQSKRPHSQDMETI